MVTAGIFWALLLVSARSVTGLPIRRRLMHEVAVASPDHWGPLMCVYQPSDAAELFFCAADCAGSTSLSSGNKIQH